MDAVAIIPWPDEHGLSEAARVGGLPRLFVVAPGAAPPETIDPLEDWIRADEPDADRCARIAILRQRVAAHRPPRPVLDDDGVLRVGDQWASLPPLEARLVNLLLARFGSVVSRRELTKAGWPDGNPGRNLLDVHVLRLRRRIEPVDLAIRTVRARGYLLEPVPGPG